MPGSGSGLRGLIERGSGAACPDLAAGKAHRSARKGEGLGAAAAAEEPSMPMDELTHPDDGARVHAVAFALARVFDATTATARAILALPPARRRGC